jgi:AcrR family transcriptional regulator
MEEQGEKQARGRGRPREVERRPAGEGLPYERPLEDLPVTAKAVLAAAREILLERGAGGLTLEAVAAAAHVDVTTIHYHFGSKAGLLEALLDSLSHEALAAFAREAAGRQSAEERLRAYIESLRTYIREGGERGGGRAYFELIPYAYRDARLRERLAALNQWHVDTSLAIVAGEHWSDEQSARRAQSIGHLVFAAVDGIELHYDTDPECYPLDEVFDLLLRFALEETERLLGGDGGSPDGGDEGPGSIGDRSGGEIDR